MISFPLFYSVAKYSSFCFPAISYRIPGFLKIYYKCCFCKFKVRGWAFSCAVSRWTLNFTSSVIRVAIDRPISWYCGPLPSGPSRMNRNLQHKEARRLWNSRVVFFFFRSNTYYLVVMGTSARPLSNTAGARRTNATTGRSRNSSSPTRTLEASAPGGIFFMKWRSIWETCTEILGSDGDTPDLIKITQITKYNRTRNKRKHTFQSLSQCKNIRVNTWHGTQSWLNIQLQWCVLLSALRDKHWSQQGVRLLTLLKSTALFSRLTSCLPSLLAGWDWGETVWPVGQSRVFRIRGVLSHTAEFWGGGYFSVWLRRLENAATAGAVVQGVAFRKGFSTISQVKWSKIRTIFNFSKGSQGQYSICISKCYAASIFKFGTFVILK